jgi:hypothetical protein
MRRAFEGTKKTNKTNKEFGCNRQKERETTILNYNFIKEKGTENDVKLQKGKSKRFFFPNHKSQKSHFAGSL